VTTYTRSDDFARRYGVDEPRVIEALRSGELRGKQLGHNWFVESWQKIDTSSDGAATVRPLVTCRQCGGPMQQDERPHNLAIRAVGVVVAIAGLSLLFSGGLLALAAGVAVIVGGASIVSHRRRYWVCTDCGYQYDRA
jgi:hypothetical protein